MTSLMCGRHSNPNVSGVLRKLPPANAYHVDSRNDSVTVVDYLSEKLPKLGSGLPRLHLASLPTPVTERVVDVPNGSRRILVKHDNLSAETYGGNKVRKLEYLLPAARRHGRKLIATFGAAGSHHALATALYARRAGFGCCCFLSHQAATPDVAAALNLHIRNGTQIVRYGGSYRNRLNTLRKHLWGRDAWVVPMGGSSWLGTIGFVAAGLELANQVDAGEVPCPTRIYVGTGTMGTAAGIALGLALAGKSVEVHAVRVSETWLTNERALSKLCAKTATMMRQIDDRTPADLSSRTNIVLRHEFFGPGYARGTEQTAEAISFAAEKLDLQLETTYTGKAMAALCADLYELPEEASVLYWQTYHARPLEVPADAPLDESALPDEFLRYFPQAA